MGAGGDFGDDAAKRGVQGRLTLDHRRQDGGSGDRMMAHDGGGCVVTTAFDAKNGQTSAHHPPLPKTCPAGNTKAMAIQSHTPVILLTRPEAQSARIAAELRTRFPEVRVVVSPLIEPRLMVPEIPARDWQGVIFSSETAVMSARRIVADGMRLPGRAFCVGRQTARLAVEAGFDAMSADGDAEDLIDLVRRSAPTGPLLYLRGAEARVDVAERLSMGGLDTVSAVVYTQEERPLTAEAVAVLGQADVVIAPVFSPRTGAILAREVKRIGSLGPLAVVAISAAAGEAFAAESVTIALTPDAPAMISAIASRLAMLAPP
jgi:uroporphyrinogen-III synthase